jgi:hypothetical protein
VKSTEREQWSSSGTCLWSRGWASFLGSAQFQLSRTQKSNGTGACGTLDKQKVGHAVDGARSTFTDDGAASMCVCKVRNCHCFGRVSPHPRVLALSQLQWTLSKPSRKRNVKHLISRAGDVCRDLHIRDHGHGQSAPHEHLRLLELRKARALAATLSFPLSRRRML